MPASYVSAKQPPHLDYLIGTSAYTSLLKENIILALRGQGAIWMKDCPQCLADGTYKKAQEREKELVIMEAEAIIRRGK